MRKSIVREINASFFFFEGVILYIECHLKISLLPRLILLRCAGRENFNCKKNNKSRVLVFVAAKSINAENRIEIVGGIDS